MFKKIISIMLLVAILLTCVSGFAVETQNVPAPEIREEAELQAEVVPEIVEEEDPVPDSENDFMPMSLEPTEGDKSIGNGISWTVINGMLMITGKNGTEVMSDFIPEEAPWYDDKDGINFIYVSGISTIGKYSFYGLNNVKGVYFTDTITAINEGAFEKCSSIQNLSLPSVLQTIGDKAFSYCSKVDKFYIPKTVNSIGNGTFSDCSSLVRIDVDAENANYISNDGILFNKGMTELIAYPSMRQGAQYPLPTTVVEIKDFAFKNASALTLITLDKNLKKIGKGAFYNCSGIVNMDITKNVAEIGEDAFYGCSSLELFTSSRENYIFKAVGGVLRNADGELIRYPANRSDTIYTLPNTIMVIKSGAFEGTRNLTEIKIHKEINAIDDYAFDNADSITKVIYGGSVQQWALVDVGVYNEGLTNAQIEYAQTVHTYSIMIGKTYDLLDYLDEAQRQELEGATEIVVTSTVPGIVAIDVENRLVTAAALGQTLVTASAKVGAAIKKVAVLVTVTDNEDAAGIEITMTEGDAPTDLKTFASVSGFNSFWDKFTWVSTDPSVATVSNGVVTPVGPGETTILATLQDGMEAITCKVIVEEKKIDYKQFFDFNATTGIITKYKGGNEADLLVPEYIDDVKVVGIGANAFENSGVQKVTVSKGVQTIDAYAFSKCSALSQVLLPEGITTIGDYAFESCDGLNTITIPATVSTNGQKWFYNCKNLRGVIFAEGRESIGQWLRDSSVQNITLPSTLKSIPLQAFYNCSSLKKINIPGSVKTIGDYAFYSCSALSDINLNNVEIIGAYSFAYNGGLKTLDLGDKLAEAGKNAFYFARSIEKVVIPGTLKNVPISMFCNVSNLSEVIFEEGVEKINSYAFTACKIVNLKLPNSLQTIDYEAFSDNNCLADVDLGIGVSTINGGAFLRCIGLKKFVVPDNVTYIGSNVLKDCSILEEITIGKGVKNISKSLFSGCNSVKRVTLNEGITEIGSYAFRSCIGLEEVNIPSSVTLIGDYAFAECSKLYNVNIGNNVNYLGAYAFYKCSELIGLTVDAKVISQRAFSDCYKLQNVVTVNNVSEIGAYAFYNCCGLKSFDFGDGITNIGESAFSNSNYSSYSNAMEIIELPNSLKKIGAAAFANSPALKSVAFGNGVDTIGASAFYRCSNLGNIKLPDSLTTISSNGSGNGAFEQCDSIKSVEFGSGINSIGNYSFFSCDSIEVVTFSDTLTQIGNYGFAYCTKLATVNNLSTDVTIGYNAFLNCKFMTYGGFDKAATSYKALASEVVGYIPLELEYKLNDFATLADSKLEIVLPQTVDVAEFKFNGEAYSGYDEKELTKYSNKQKLIVPVTERSGKFTIIIQPKEWGNITSTASMSYYAYGNTKNEIIGSVDCSLPDVTVNSVDVTSKSSVIVEGMTKPKTSVSLYVDNNYVKETTSNSQGIYKTSVELGTLENYRDYTIKAEVTDKTPATTIVRYENDAPNLESLVMYYGKDGYSKSRYDLTSISKRLVLCWGDYFSGSARGYSYYFTLNLSNADDVDKVYVVSTRNNEKEYLEATWNSKTGKYVTKGYFKDDYSYVIGTLSVEYTRKEKDVPILSPSDTVAYYDMNSGSLAPSINGYTANSYSASIAVGDELKDKLGSIINVDTATENVVVTSELINKVEGAENSYRFIKGENEYILSIDTSIMGTFTMYLLDLTNSQLTSYDISFTASDEEGFYDLLLVEDVMSAVEDIAQKYSALYGIDIYKDNLNNDIKNLGLSSNEEEEALTRFKQFSVKKRAFLLSSFALNAAVAVGELSPDMKVCDLLTYLMKDDVNYFRELKLANIYKMSSDFSIRWYIDPSGFVYEGVTANRLSGVTATIYYKGEDGTPIKWDDEDMGQNNPVSTDSNGVYRWDVLPGQWQVVFEKEGYKTYTTEWMTVPPAHTDVNIELEPDIAEVNAPEVKLTTEEAVLTFADYMDPTSVKNSINIVGMSADDYTVEYNVGNTMMTEGYTNKDIAGNEYAKIYTIKFKDKLLAGDSINLTVNSANSHIENVSSKVYQAELMTQEPEIKEVTLLEKNLSNTEDGDLLLLKYRNNTGKAIDVCNIIVSMYGADGRLIKLVPIEVNAFGVYENTDTLSVGLEEGWTYCKLFAWDKENKPVGKMETFNKQ